MPAHASYLPDWARRAIRTFAVAFAGVFILSLFGWLQGVQEWASCTVDCRAFPDASPLGKAAVAAAVAGFVAVLNALQNYLEDRTAMPALLKAPASSGRNPTPGDAGHVDWVGALVVLVAVLILLAVFGVIG